MSSRKAGVTFAICATVDPVMGPLRLNLLGGFAVEAGAQPAAALSRAPKKVRALLAYLALNPGVAHPRQKLATLLWEESGENQARQSLRQALADLRQALPDDQDALVCTNETVTLSAGSIDVDVFELERARGIGGGEALDRAVTLYQGDLLEGLHTRAQLFDDWLMLERSRLREHALEAMTHLLADLSAGGTLESSVRVALRVLALDPLRESAHRSLMQLYAKQGRYASALKQYQTCRRLLRRELGVEPEPATRELHAELMRARTQEQPHSAVASTPVASQATAIGAGSIGEARQPEAAATSDKQLAAVTVLSVRLADFGAVTRQRDPEALRESLNAYYAAVDSATTRHEGVVAYHADDAVVSIFGLPGARGNDTECAARAAAAIHSVIAAPSRVRIGIANGSVLRDEVGSAHHRQNAFIGSCIAVAASLARYAAPGETLIADAAYQTIARHFDATPAPEETLLASDVGGAWELGCMRSTTSQPFIGRQREQDIFTAALDACRTSGSGQTFLIRGEAGIGKSRLIEEFEALARGRGFATHKALVLDFGSGMGDDPIRVLAHRLLDLTTHSTVEQIQQAVQEALENGELELSQHVFVADLLGLPLAPPLKAAYDAMDLTTREHRKVATLTRLMRSASARAPLLLAIEDIHWASAHLLPRLASIASGVAGCAALLVLSTRSEADPLDASWRAATHGAALTTIDLAPLGDAESAQLAQILVKDDEAFARRCVERAAGNPLFLEQLLRTKGGPSEQVPHSVQSIVRMRLDRLHPQDRHAARAAALLGQRFSLPALQYLLGDPLYSCVPLLAQQLVRPWANQYLFTHALVADAIYGSLPKSQRARLHARAAEWFSERDAALAAEHLDRAEDPQAPQAYLRAARIRASEYQNDEALRLVRRGLMLNCPAATWHELACLEAELLQEAGAIDDSIAVYSRAHARARSPAQRCRAWTGMAAGLRVQDRYGEALDLLERAQSVATRPEELALIEFHRGNIMVPLGRPEACLQAHESALRYARAAASPLLEARALSGLGDAHYLLGCMRTAYDHFAQCIAVCRERGFGRIEVANLAMQGATRLYAAEVESAIADARAAAELAVAVGNRRAEAIARNVLGYLLYYAADHEAAQEQARQSLLLAQSLRSTRFHIKSLLNLGLAEIGLERAQRAETHLDEAQAIAERSGIDLWTPWLLGACALAAGDVEKRRRALAQGEAMLANGGAGHSYLHFYQLATEAALMSGDWRNAARYADLLEHYSRVEHLPWSDFWVARARALVQRARQRSNRSGDSQLLELAHLARQTGLKAGLRMLQAAVERPAHEGNGGASRDRQSS